MIPSIFDIVGMRSLLSNIILILLESSIPQIVAHTFLDFDTDELRFRKLISMDPTIVKLTAESDDKVSISVHKELLCGFSPYYRAAIDGSFEEAKKSSFTAKTTPEALRMFVKWVYTRRLRDDDGTIDLDTAVDLYIFADMIDVLALRRDIVTFWPRESILIA